MNNPELYNSHPPFFIGSKVALQAFEPLGNTYDYQRKLLPYMPHVRQPHGTQQRVPVDYVAAISSGKRVLRRHIYLPERIEELRAFNESGVAIAAIDATRRRFERFINENTDRDGKLALGKLARALAYRPSYLQNHFARHPSELSGLDLSKKAGKTSPFTVNAEAALAYFRIVGEDGTEFKATTGDPTEAQP